MPAEYRPDPNIVTRVEAKPQFAGLSGGDRHHVEALLRRCAFPPPGSTVDCAVSGGPDSSALLVLAAVSGCTITAHHVDHQLRPGSSLEANVVAGLADRFGAAFESHTVVVGDGPNLQARARRARLAVLPDGVLTGHTADDQAETLLLALGRGTGPVGFAGMAPGNRPILGLRRSETVDLCRHLDIEVVDDPSNRSPRHRRSRVRHEVLPLLDDVFDRDVASVITRQVPIASELVDLLDDLAEGVEPTDCRELEHLPRAVRRWVVRRWLTDVLSTGHPPDLASVERVLAVVDGSATATEIAGGIEVRRSSRRLTWRRL